MPKIAIIGAGSTVFATEIMADILSTPALESGVFALVDIDPARLELAHQMSEHLIRLSGRHWSVTASTDRKAVLADSDYIINTIEVAGLPNVRHDYEIPLKYGVDQCIGDTIGPGGLFKALRTLPAWIEILKDVERLAPRSLVMNYTNPMSLTVLTGVRASWLPIVIPLAIELAAARTRMLSVEQIAERLRDAFHLLTGGSRSALPRHQTLKAMIDWPYNLLSPQEKLLLARLSVFAGGWTLEAAEEVCADSVARVSIPGSSTSRETDGQPDGQAEKPALRKEQVLDLLGRLVDQSLVQFEPSSSAEPRYRMLETVRQYAAEALEHSPDCVRAVRQQHCAFYLGWLAQRDKDLTGHRQVGERPVWMTAREGPHRGGVKACV